MFTLWSVLLPIGKKYTFQGNWSYDQCEKLIDSLIVMQQDSFTPHGEYIVSGIRSTVRLCVCLCTFVHVCMCVCVYLCIA